MDNPTILSNYSVLKEYFDDVLNKDKTTYKNSNDEPTPIDCVNEMISKIPESFWKQKGLKILDPCCGNGNFHFVIYHELHKHRTKRRILEEILYFNDINEDRIKNVKSIFGVKDYELNITQKDFLKFSEDKDENKYDLIVANPPYAKFLDDGSRTSKNHNLIKDFINKTLRLLKPNGYLLYITPDNWMSLSDRNTLIVELTKLQIHYLNIHNAKKYFRKIGSSFTWYLIENSPSYKDFCVEGLWKRGNYSSMVKSQVREYIPLLYNNSVQKILEKTVDNDKLEKYKVETSSDLHKYTKRDLISTEQSDEYKYKLIHTPKQTVYAKRPHKFQEGYKVFISTTDTYKIFIDECGMTQSIVFIRCNSKEEAENIKNILEHKLYRFLNNICRWGNFNNIRILQRFPVYKKNDKEIYEYFGITDEEQKYIESNL